MKTKLSAQQRRLIIIGQTLSDEAARTAPLSIVTASTVRMLMASVPGVPYTSPPVLVGDAAVLYAVDAANTCIEITFREIPLTPAIEEKLV